MQIDLHQQVYRKDVCKLFGQTLTVMTKEQQTIGETVAKNFKAVRVFRKYGIYFCCGGDIPPQKVCKDRGFSFD